MKEKVRQFIRGTKIISRVLFFFWLLMIVVGPTSIPMDIGSIIVGYTLLLLLPAILIERKNNPMWIEAREQAQIKKYGEEIVHNRKKNKPPLSYRIFGTIFLIFGTIFVLAAITNMRFNYKSDLWILLIGGALIGVVGVLSLSGKLSKVEKTSNNDVGVYEVRNDTANNPYKPYNCYEHYNYYKDCNFSSSDDDEYDSDDDNDEWDILDQIDGMEGHEFEHFCAHLLKQNGFVNVSVTQGSGDQGVDVLATKAGVKYAIQCKNYATPLSNRPIQEVTAGKMFYNCHVGVVMTNSTFTPGAQALAQATGVLLWDRKVLCEMLETADED